MEVSEHRESSWGGNDERESTQWTTQSKALEDVLSCPTCKALGSEHTETAETARPAKQPRLAAQQQSRERQGVKRKATNTIVCSEESGSEGEGAV